MTDFLAQIVLARRSPGDEGWMNILVVVVMAVFWMVAGIVKAMKSKSGDEPPPGNGHTRELPAHGRGARQQLPARAQRPAGPAQQQPSDLQQKRTTFADLRAAARRFAAEAEQAFQSQTTTPAPRQDGPSSKPHVQPEIKPIAEPVVPPSEAYAGGQAPSLQMPLAQRLSDLRSDYADPDNLRKAILHYEILGPPLSLRD